MLAPNDIRPGRDDRTAGTTRLRLTSARHAHFIYVGCATRNEIYFYGKKYSFIGVFEDFAEEGTQREWLDRMNRMDGIFDGNRAARACPP